MAVLRGTSGLGQERARELRGFDEKSERGERRVPDVPREDRSVIRRGVVARRLRLGVIAEGDARREPFLASQAAQRGIHRDPMQPRSHVRLGAKRIAVFERG